MIRIRKVKIQNFRGIKFLEWHPSPGVNCLVGPGDSGKSSVLDAIDWCLGSYRSLPISDADFNNLDTTREISIEVTLGNLSENLLDLTTYGNFLRGIHADGTLEDEPAQGLETVITLRFSVGDDLEPNWTLVSERAEEAEIERNLRWKDRLAISPIRLGVRADRHLTWQRGSILNDLTEEKTESLAELVRVAREVRETFGEVPRERLEEILVKVKKGATSGGISVGCEVSARLDPQALSFTSGAISLHDEDKVPLRCLGLGSSRLLVAMLQKQAGEEGNASIALVDEVEIGLEPYRIAKLLVALGSKAIDAEQNFQVFMTTHSSVVLRELAADQLYILRASDKHIITRAGTRKSATQGLLRSFPEGFLGRKILVCEGATEVGFIRGLNQFQIDQNRSNFSEFGLVCIDAGGDSKIYAKAIPFRELQYSVAVLRDDDKKFKCQTCESSFEADDGKVFKWKEGQAIEDAIFDCFNNETVVDLVKFADKWHGGTLVQQNLASKCNCPVDLESFLSIIDANSRLTIANVAKSGGWFKRISIMEKATRSIIAPRLSEASAEFKNVICGIWEWVKN